MVGMSVHPAMAVTMPRSSIGALDTKVYTMYVTNDLGRHQEVSCAGASRLGGILNRSLGG
jgi:hypothetical protein